ncbi:packaging ATPase [Klosneuvirus KNV1]|uniref:Packaging ATPase n=1 Tax=Klosneuvirus KNV1 TaxID=1977640 RepID=A0A1V0SHU1_9VIRU|nr:packaging ATPase [Klosneuvirus KNV1]
MKYCIYQIDDKSNEKIINILDYEADFIDTIKENIGTKYHYKLLESVSENDIKANSCFTENYYLLVNDKQIKLVQKYKKVSNGYMYNTSKDAINILFTWKMIPFECEEALNKYIPFVDDEATQLLNSSESDSDNNIVEYITDNSPKQKSNVMDQIINNINYLASIQTSNIKQISCNNGTLQINTLNINDICQHPSICMIAKRGSGKSWLVRDIISKMKKSTQFFDNTLIMSKTEKMNSLYKSAFPQTKILYEYDSNALKEYLTYQEIRIDEARINYYKLHGIPNSTSEPKFVNYMNEQCSGCVVLDDCLNSKGTWMNDYPLLELFYNAKHYYTTFILTMQFPLGIKPELRCNFDYVFMLSEDFFSNQKRLFDHYAGMFPNFDTFRQVFLQLTDNYGSMVIMNRGVNKTLNERIFYYKVQDPFNPLL